MQSPSSKSHPQPKPKRQVKIDKIKSKQQCKRQMGSNFKSLDQFGQSVSFTYDGQDQFKTTLGAFVSVIIAIILIAYGIYKATVLFGRQNPTVSKTTLMRDIWEQGDFSPQESGFDFAFGTIKELDPTIGHFTVKYYQSILTNKTNADGSKIRSKTSTNLKFAKCGENGFNFTDQELVTAIGIQNYQCLTDQDYSFKGNFYSQEFHYLEIKLMKCQNSTSSSVTCKNKTMIDNFFQEEVFNFAFVNTYFDTESFENEIQYFIDDSLFFELQSDTVKKANFYLQKQQADLEDDLLQLGQTTSSEFHQVVNIRSYDDDYSETDGSVVSVFMRLDKTYDSYQRKVYSILDLLGDVGGLQGSLLSIGGFLIGFIIQKIFMSQVIKKIYQIRKQNDIEDDLNFNPIVNNNKVIAFTELSRKRTQNKLSQDVSNSAISINQTIIPSEKQGFNNDQQQVSEVWQNNLQNLESEIYVDSQQRISKYEEMHENKEKQTIKERENILQKEYKFKKVISNKDLIDLLFSMTNRTRFRYTLRNIIAYFLKCSCIKNLGDNRRDRTYKKHFLFSKAQDKFAQELDFVRIVKTLRKFKMLAQSMLSQKHRMILKFQRLNLVETSSSSSDSDDGDFDAVRMMENKNPFTRLAIYGRMKKMIQGFEEQKVKILEKNMMRGIFRKNLKDFNEDQKEKADHQTLLMRLKSEMRLEESEREEQIEIPSTRATQLKGQVFSGLKPVIIKKKILEHKKVVDNNINDSQDIEEVNYYVNNMSNSSFNKKL